MNDDNDRLVEESLNDASGSDSSNEGYVDRRIDVAVSVAVVAIGVVLIVGSFSIRHGTVTQDPIGVTGFPRAVGSILVVTGAALAIRRLRSWATTSDGMVSSDGGPSDEPEYAVSWFRPFLYVLASIAWVLLLPTAGYILATTLFCAGLLGASSLRTFPKLVIFPLLMAVATWWMFDRAIGISLPTGWFESILNQVVPRLG